MNKLKCFYFEDDYTHYQDMKRTLEEMLEPIPLHFTHMSSVTDAIKHLDNVGAKYHVMFIDLLVKQDDGTQLPEGLDLVKIIKKRFDVTVAAVSQCEEKGWIPGTEERFFDRGGDFFIDKSKMRVKDSHYRDGMREKIESDIHHRGHELPYPNLPPLERTDETISLSDAINRVGANTISILLSQIYKDCKSARPSFISQGYSGALVLRVSLRLERNVPRTILLKLSTDSEKLLKEINNLPDPYSEYADTYVRYRPVLLRKYDWHAIVSNFVMDSQTYEDWLKSSPRVRDVNKALSLLFLNGLKLEYGEGMREHSKSPLELLIPGISQRVSILHGISTIVKLAKQKGNISDPDNIIEFLEKGHEFPTLNPDFIHTSTYVCPAHGDLHLRNILIQDSGKPILIDTGNRGEHHWAIDPARFITYLCITAWNSGFEAHEWDELTSWTDIISEAILINGMTNISQGKNSGAEASIRWVLSNLSNIFSELIPGSLPTWEFRFALMVELLRISSYETIPTPKRCLALGVASRLLTHLVNNQPLA